MLKKEKNPYLKKKRRKRRIVGIVTALAMLSCMNLPSYAYTADDYLKDQAVNVVELDNKIVIYARMQFGGKASSDKLRDGQYRNITSATYKEAFIDGVEDGWEGEYSGKPIKVYITEVNDKSDKPSVHVNINYIKDMKSIPCASKTANVITMYVGDGRSIAELYYTLERYKATAAHEFGHILGLADVYNDTVYNTSMLTSLMNKSAHAQEVDYYMLLQHKTWLLDTYYKYSDDAYGLIYYSILDRLKSDIAANQTKGSDC